MPVQFRACVSEADIEKLIFYALNRRRDIHPKNAHKGSKIRENQVKERPWKSMGMRQLSTLEIFRNNKRLENCLQWRHGRR